MDISATYTDQHYTGYLPILTFIDCLFVNNSMFPNHVGNNYSTYNTSGNVVFTTFNVFFEGTVTFINNKYTALKLVSATLILRAGTSLHFISNTGVKGGAVALYGFSTLVGTDNAF